MCLQKKKIKYTVSVSGALFEMRIPSLLFLDCTSLSYCYHLSCHRLNFYNISNSNSLLPLSLMFLMMCCSVVQSLSPVRLFVTPWTAAQLPSLSFTISRSLLKLLSLESVMPSNHPIL